MKKTIVAFLFLFLAVPFLNAQGKKPLLDEILARIAENETKIKSIELEFSQEMSFSIINETNTFIGQLKYKHPDKLYYQTFTSPAKDKIKQVIVSNGEKLWAYNVEANQVLVDQWKNWKGIGYFLPGLYNPKGKVTDLNKTYKFVLDSEDEKNYILLLTPKKKIKSMFDAQLGSSFKFYLWISKTDYYPVKSKFIAENITATTEILSYKPGAEIPDETFNFKIPEGAEVLRMFK
ncbi:MAG: hypothetical protein A2297_03325 [Elusimicrobia bacterium RIFOXYB2_FULL_48_7]|nr:MAG: hypothetical protein A2297_03325 [Elusimicrobia bacterium RIFOXYB2_FULL_48_7]